MASETDPTTEEHIGDIAVDSTGVSEGKKNGGKRGGGKDKKKEKEVPIEEMYDLSQPIKRVSLCLCVAFLRV
jgi:hypothetical protein